MEIANRALLPTGRAALLATACLIFPLSAQEPAAIALQRHIAANVDQEEAWMLLEKGDEAYQKGEFATAVEAYSGAREALLPKGPVAGLHAVATERLVLASIAQARVLIRHGDLTAARAALEAVLADDVAPDHSLARLELGRLDDPIRTNPALTAAHVKNVDQVRRLLYTAEGAFNLGKFDESKALYQEVLAIDPHNTAARRGLERVASEKSAYQAAAYDHARAEMLAQVDQAWELPVPLPPMEIQVPGLPAEEQPGFIPVASKLERIIFPSVNFDQSSIGEIVEFLRVRSVELDTLETDPARRGVNFTLDFGAPDSERATQLAAQRVSLRLSNVPLDGVLRYLNQLTGTTYTTDDYSVIIRPLGSGSAEMVSRTYRVPPNFLSELSAGQAGEAAADSDPFGSPAPAGGGLLARRLSPVEAFRAQGVTFPDGSSATFTAASNTLLVVNTPDNQDVIEQIISTVTQEEPVLVAVRVKVIRTQQSRLEELGFDWVLDPVGMGGSNWIPGTNPLYLSGGTQGSGGDLSDVAVPTGQLSRNPITAGNRSGHGALTQNNIDAVLGFERPTFESRGPGVFQVSRVLDSASVQALMRGLDQKTGVDMMAQPEVLTRNGQAASIQIIREFMYASEYEPPELPNSVGTDDFVIVDGEVFGGSAPLSPVTPSTPTAFTMEPVGVVLEVLPTVDADRRNVDITLSPSFVEFDGYINYGTPINSTAPGSVGSGFGPQSVELTPNAILMPVFSKMRTSTSLTVADGATIAFGGLIQDAIQDVEDQTPVLGSLPIVGRLFQSKVRQPVKTAIVFLVTVDLLDPAGRPLRER